MLTGNLSHKGYEAPYPTAATVQVYILKQLADHSTPEGNPLCGSLCAMTSTLQVHQYAVNCNAYWTLYVQLLMAVP